jgi:septation ring formation regulator EzrA
MNIDLVYVVAGIVVVVFAAAFFMRIKLEKKITQAPKQTEIVVEPAPKQEVVEVKAPAPKQKAARKTARKKKL